MEIEEALDSLITAATNRCCYQTIREVLADPYVMDARTAHRSIHGRVEATLGNMALLAGQASEFIFQLIVLAGEPIRPSEDPVDMDEEMFKPTMWDEHRDYPLHDWQDEVADHRTICGYWLWVTFKILGMDTVR